MSAPLLETHALCKRFGGLLATDSVSLSVRRGECHALIGPNGAGKTTLIGQLSGSLRPDAGVVRFDGRDVTCLGAHQRAMLGFARSFQITSILNDFSVLDNVGVALQAVSGSSFAFWRPVAAETALSTEATAILDKVGLAGLASRRARDLSHGEHRQLEIALALATRPQLMLLDEPMAGMGPDESERMVRLITELKGRYTILLVEHDMDAVFRLADRISVLVAGRVIATGTVDEIRANDAVKCAYLGEEEVD
ncbi:MAG: ABC transporter ATP-binding protein [Rhodocyclaceae bacterium]|nr:ABC transporter ATP-binding protein [Rhodocyclaceae bacterium]